MIGGGAGEAVPPPWQSHRTCMGLPYTRYEFTRFQSRQEQVRPRDVQKNPRFWMDTTAYDPCEDLTPDEDEAGAAGGDGEGGDE